MITKSTALIVMIWGVFSAFNVYANDVKNYSWSLFYQGNYKVGGYLSEAFSMYGSDILNSQSSELTGLGIGAVSHFRHHYRALYRDSSLTVTVNQGAAFDPDIANSIWLFSRGLGQPPESAFHFNIRTTSILRGQRITNHQHRLFSLAALFCCPCTVFLLGTAGYSLCEGVDERRESLRSSHPGNLHSGVGIYRQSLAAGGAYIPNEPGIPIPANISVIHLSSRDDATLQWLRRAVNSAIREDVIIIPGFIHQPTRVRVEVIPPDTARGNVYHTVNLSSLETPAFWRIRMNVIPVSGREYSISALFINIGEAELRVSVYDAVSPPPVYASPTDAPPAYESSTYAPPAYESSTYAPPAYPQSDSSSLSALDQQVEDLPAPFSRGGLGHAFQPSGSGGL